MGCNSTDVSNELCAANNYDRETLVDQLTPRRLIEQASLTRPHPCLIFGARNTERHRLEILGASTLGVAGMESHGTPHRNLVLVEADAAGGGSVVSYTSVAPQDGHLGLALVARTVDAQPGAPSLARTP